MISYDGDEHGQLFRHLTATLLLLIFIADLICLILSIYYYNLAISDPTFITETQDGGVLFVYLLAIPFVTLAHTSIQLLLSNCSRFLTPKAMVCFGGILTLGWIVTASIWTECELVLPLHTENLPGWCPQSRLSVHGAVFQRGLTLTKDLLGWMVVVGYVVFTLVACFVWEKTWMGGKNRGGEEEG